MGRRLTDRGRERRAQLIDFAIRRFAENGYHPTSVGEIVDGLGVGKGVFYWYFASKDELFLEILKDAQHDLRRTQRREIGDEPDPLHRIERGIRASIRWYAENGALVTLLEFAATEERFAAAIHRGREIAVQDVAAHIKEGIAAGVIRDLDPEWAAHAVIGATNRLARVLIAERDEPVAVVADTAVAFCLDGLRDQFRN